MTDILRSIEAPINPNIPDLLPGDGVSVHVKIKEGNRERIQEFKGIVLYTHNNGTNSTFTVRRLASNGIGVERTFLTRSPRIDKVVVERHSKVRRGRLYFLRDRSGKALASSKSFNPICAGCATFKVLLKQNKQECIYHSCFLLFAKAVWYNRFQHNTSLFKMRSANESKKTSHRNHMQSGYSGQSG